MEKNLIHSNELHFIVNKQTDILKMKIKSK